MKSNFIKRKPRKTHGIFIRIIDNRGVRSFDSYGRELIPTRWVEVEEINLGSSKKPNKEIIEVKIEPIIYEGEE